MTIHIKKLVVGIDSLDDFAKWQADEIHDFNGQKANIIYTRNRPKQEDEILKNGGSAYRIIKGKMCCRQKILGFESITGHDGKKRCLIYMDTELIETYHIPHRPFQGWRYLKQADVPDDIGPYMIGSKQNDIPAELAANLRDAGLL